MKTIELGPLGNDIKFVNYNDLSINDRINYKGKYKPYARQFQMMRHCANKPINTNNL